MDIEDRGGAEGRAGGQPRDLGHTLETLRDLKHDRNLGTHVENLQGAPGALSTSGPLGSGLRGTCGALGPGAFASPLALGARALEPQALAPWALGLGPRATLETLGGPGALGPCVGLVAWGYRLGLCPEGPVVWRGLRSAPVALCASCACLWPWPIARGGPLERSGPLWTQWATIRHPLLWEPLEGQSPHLSLLGPHYVALLSGPH